MNSSITNWIVMRDNVVTEKFFDESNGGSDAATIYLRHCERNYLGSFQIVSLTDKDLKKFLKSREKLTSNMQVARAARNLTR